MDALRRFYLWRPVHRRLAESSGIWIRLGGAIGVSTQARQIGVSMKSEPVSTEAGVGQPKAGRPAGTRVTVRSNSSTTEVEAIEATATQKRPRGLNRLTAVAVRAFAKKRQVGRKLSDGGGLYLTVTPKGTLTWRMKYRYGNKERLYGIGVYPGVELAEARKERDEARKLIREGKDPVVERRLERVTQGAALDATFETVARDWLSFERRRKDWSDVHYTKSLRAFERDVFPRVGGLPIATITPPILVELVEHISRRGAKETAARILQHVRSVFDVAKTKALFKGDNPAVPVAKILPTPKDRKPRPAVLTAAGLREIMRSAELAPLSPSVRMAHRLIAFTAERLENVVEASWVEFSLDDPTTEPMWTIPRTAMKIRRGRPFDHVTILPATMASELRGWRRVTGDTGYLFPSPTGRGKHITKESLDKAYSRTLGLAGKHSPNGWRASFATLAKDEGFSRDAVELSLDHIHDNAVVRAYDRGERRVERIALAKWWDNILSGS